MIEDSNGPSSAESVWPPTLETLLYAAAVVAALLLRLLLLDARPLSVDEGSLAWQAYRILLGQFGAPLEDGPLPTYATVASLALFAAGDFAARFLSVLGGTLLTCAPLLVRRQLGRQAALVSSWALALSPLFLFASRTVGSGIIPAALSLGLWGLIDGVGNRPGQKPFLLAAWLAAMLTCGPTGLSCIVAFGLAYLLSHPTPGDLITDVRTTLQSSPGKQAVALLVLGAVALSTGLGANLSGAQYILVDLWAGWLGSFNPISPKGGLVLLLALYELPVIILGMGRLLYALMHRDRTDMFLSLWAMLLLLAAMFRPSVALPGMIVALVPIYLLASRVVASTLSMTRGAAIGWRWVGGVVAITVPIVVGMIMLNRSAILAEPVPQEYLIGEAALGICAILVVLVLLDGAGRRAAAWYILGAAMLGFSIHTAVFLNYRTDSAPAEIVIGQQLSPQLRDAAEASSYYSTYFNAQLFVSPQLKGPLEWYLRDAASVDYSGADSNGLSIRIADSVTGPLPGGSERLPGLYSPSLGPSGLTWKGAWGWAMARNGLVRSNPRDIILRIPLGGW